MVTHGNDKGAVIFVCYAAAVIQVVVVGVCQHRVNRKLNKLYKAIIADTDREKEEMGILALGRSLLRDGKMMYKKGSSDNEVHVFLFDHMLLITRKKDSTYRVFRKVPQLT